MPDLVPAPQEPKPPDRRLSPQVDAWVSELQTLWTAAGTSINRFAAGEPIDKGTVSRYLSGQRVPKDRWFLSRLLEIQTEKGKPVAPEVVEHLTRLQLAALEVAHPTEYRVRQASDQLEVANFDRDEAERTARKLERELAENLGEIGRLTEQVAGLQAAWNADRAAMQAETVRLETQIAALRDEVAEHRRQLELAHRSRADAERSCRELEELLDHLGTLPADVEPVPGAQPPRWAEGGTIQRGRPSRALRRRDGRSVASRVALTGVTAAATAAAITGAVLFFQGDDPQYALGAEVPPPTGYGQVAGLHSANGFAIAERLTTTQAGHLVIAARPANADSQLWAFWYGDNQPNRPSDKAVILEAYRTNGSAAPSQGSVIDQRPSGSTILRRVTYSDTQFWTFHRADGPWYQITNQGRCLTAVQADAPLEGRTCGSGTGQRWKVTNITDGRA